MGPKLVLPKHFREELKNYGRGPKMVRNREVLGTFNSSKDGAVHYHEFWPQASGPRRSRSTYQAHSELVGRPAVLIESKPTNKPKKRADYTCKLLKFR
jgi:hypothetical protein